MCGQYKSVGWSNQYSESYDILCWNLTGHLYLQLWLSFFCSYYHFCCTTKYPSHVFPCILFLIQHQATHSSCAENQKSSNCNNQLFLHFVLSFLSTVVAWSRKQIYASVSRGNQNERGCFSPGSEDICLKLNLYKLLKSTLPATVWLFEQWWQQQYVFPGSVHND